MVPPEELVKALDLQLPETGAGKQGVLDLVRHVLAYSVNTWDQGFLDKLYASNNAVSRDCSDISQTEGTLANKIGWRGG